MILLVLDEKALGWRGSTTGLIAPTFPSGIPFGNFFQSGRSSAWLLPGIGEYRNEESNSPSRVFH